MRTTIGQIEAIFRYPIKSMRGERLDSVTLGWHGLDGDRRFAFRRLGEAGAFPWLSAGKLPELVLFTPLRPASGNLEAPPTHVLTPDGRELPLFGDALAAEVARRHGSPVEMMQLKHGIFDDAAISVINSETVREVGRLSGTTPDVRRFRPNILVRSLRGVPFEEDLLLGGVLTFGEDKDAPGVTVTQRDVRCGMVNIDPDSGRLTPEVLKSVVNRNQNNAGIYATVTGIGRLAIGQAVVLCRGEQ